MCSLARSWDWNEGRIKWAFCVRPATVRCGPKSVTDQVVQGFYGRIPKMALIDEDLRCAEDGGFRWPRVRSHRRSNAADSPLCIGCGWKARRQSEPRRELGGMVWGNDAATGPYRVASYELVVRGDILRRRDEEVRL